MKKDLAWNELKPNQQAVLWVMAKYEENFWSQFKILSHTQRYSIEDLFEFSRRFFHLNKDEFFKIVNELSKKTFLVESDCEKISLAGPWEDVLQVNSAAPYNVLDELETRFKKLQHWYYGDLMSFSDSALNEIYDYLARSDSYYEELYCFLAPTREYKERFRYLEDAVWELHIALFEKLECCGKLFPEADFEEE